MYDELLSGVRIVTVVGFSLVLSACDPGFAYTPQGLTRSIDGLWAADVSGVVLETTGISGLIGSEHVGLELRVTNHGEGTCEVTDADLVVGEKVYGAEFVGGGAPEWRSVAPGLTARISLSWNLDEAAVEALGPGPLVRLKTKNCGAMPPVFDIRFRTAQR